MQHGTTPYIHDASFPTSSGGGSGGRRDGAFGASTLDVTRLGMLTCLLFFDVLV